MIGCFDGNAYANFSRFGDFLDHVCTPKYSGWRWFSHNGGRFDSNAMFDWLRANRPEQAFSFYCAGSCVVSLTLRNGAHSWRFCDSYRLLDASQHRLTHEFDVDHKKGSLVNAMKSDNPQDAIAYNRDDCIGLYEVLTRFFAEFDAQAETVASFAVQVFQMHFLKHAICKPSRKVEDFIRQSYFGGRCEVYRWDSARLNKYDVNSLYPSVMREPVPVEFVAWSKRLPDDDSEIGFYEAKINYPETYLPALPTIIGHRLFFPVGKFSGHFTSMELREAIQDRASVKILHGTIFKTEPIFREFAETLYQRRVEAKAAGNLAVDWVCKKVLNSSYGKFGMRRMQRCYISDPGTVRLHPMMEEWEALDEAALARVNPRIWPMGETGSGVAYYDKESRAACILPHIASAITSRARCVTRAYLRAARKIWYTDTDSVFTDAELQTGSALGEMKLEAVGEFVPYGLKEYRFDQKYNIKGVSITRTDPDTGEKTVHPEIAEDYLAGIQVANPRRAGLLESLRAGECVFRSVAAVKQRRPRVEKRARDGDDTRAWEAEEIMNYKASFTSMSGKKIFASQYGLKGFPIQKRKQVTDEDSLLAAIKSLGGINPLRLANRRTEWKEALPGWLWAQVMRDDGEPLDLIVLELQGIGYLYDVETLLPALVNPSTRNAGMQMSFSEE